MKEHDDWDLLQVLMWRKGAKALLVYTSIHSKVTVATELN